MAKWTKKKTRRLVEDPHLPPQRRTGELQATNNNDEKTEILTEGFFPQPAPADLSDIDYAGEEARALSDCGCYPISIVDF
jgi:hypothetical protein